MFPAQGAGFRSGSVSETVSVSNGGVRIAFGHEKLDVYHTAIEYVGWAYRLYKGLKGRTPISRSHPRRQSGCGRPTDVQVGEDDQTDGPYYLRNPFDAEPGWAVSSINMDLGELLKKSEAQC